MFFHFVFLFSFLLVSSLASSSFFVCFFFTRNKDLHSLHVITNDILSVFLSNFPPLRFVWPLQNFLVGRNVLIAKPDVRSCMFGCACARIFIQSALLPRQDKMFDCFLSFLPYIHRFCVITLLQPGSSSCYNISSNASIRLLTAGSASFFLILS